MFENNIKSLKNIRLKNTLQSIDIADCISNIAFVETLDGNVVFLKDNIPVEETTSPIEYIKSIITDNMKSFTNNDIIISVGFGVGYILDELYTSTKSKIVIYEPDTKYLRFIFETIDLTKFLSDKRVFISDNKDECISYILKTYLNEDKIEFIQSKVLAIFYQDDIKEFTDDLYLRLKNKIVDINTVKELSKDWVNNIIGFISESNQYYSITDLKNKFSGKNALILGAGPSLADNIEAIKANQDKYTIFAVNKTLDYLYSQGIVPDFAVVLDAKNIKMTLKVDQEYISQLNIIQDWKTDCILSKVKPNNQILYFSDNELFLEKYFKDLNIDLNASVQSTTILAILAANMMDFSKIYLCGLDLVFKGNQAYAKGDNIDIQDNKAVVSKAVRNIVEVETITGDMAQTREDYSVFINSLEELIKYKNLKNLYNITDFGALIKGMNYTTFDRITTFDKKYDTNNIISQLEPAKYDFRKYLSVEKQAMVDIYDKVINHHPINLVIKDIVNKTTLLYEYLQFDMLEYARNSEDQAIADKFSSNCVLAIDRLLSLTKI